MKKFGLLIKAAAGSAIFRLVFAQGISLIGSRCTSFVLGIWLFLQTGKASEILLIPFFAEVPALLANPFLGMIVDRLPRKTALILADSVQALGSILLAVSIWQNAFSLAFLYVVVILQGLFASLQSLAADATVAPLTRMENRHKVNAVKEMLFPLAGIIAPVAAGVLFFQWGLFSVIAFDLATYLLSMTVVISAPIPCAQQSAPDKKAPLKKSWEGFRYLRGRRRLLLFALFFGTTNFMWNGPLELVTPYLIAGGATPTLLSMSVSFMSIGILAGVLLLAVQKKRRQTITLFAAILWNGVWMMAFGIARHPVLLAASLFLMMMPLPVANALFKTELQNSVPQPLQGRVFSVVYQIFYGTAPLSFLLTGPLTDRVLTPMMSHTSSGLLHRLFGAGPQAGMGLLLSAAGLLVVLVSVVLFLLRAPKVQKR